MNERLQWHPAFYASMQIELEDERENLIFENEHQLGTKPKEIDVLIVKKENSVPVRKNIGRIFRKHNVIEYKSPADSLRVDDYYKVYGYACFYKSDTEEQDSISITEVTLTFVSSRYPRKLARHLQDVRGYTVEKREDGIYIVGGDIFPIQFIVTKELPPKENLWLYSLTDNIKDTKEAKELVLEYEKHRKSVIYESIMDIIVRANYQKFKEVNGMCKALEELMQPYIREQVEAGRQEVMEQGWQQGMEQGMEQGIRQGESRVNRLNSILMETGRTDDIFKAVADVEYQKKLFLEFNL